MEVLLDGRARVYLQPIAAPSILGLCALAGSALIVAADGLFRLVYSGFLLGGRDDRAVARESAA